MNQLKNELKRIEAEILKHQKLLTDPELAPLAQEEIEKLTTQKKALEQSLSKVSDSTYSNQSQPQAGSHDEANAIIEIRGAAGGDEAKLWAQDLKRMYLRFADNQGYKVQEIDESTVKIIGRGVFGLFKYESGVHRVQRIPETEKQGRIHTSTATVAVLPEIHESQIKISPDDLEWQFTRAGGPGGQYVNKAATAVRLTHKPTGTVVTVRQERLQQQNKAIAVDILRSKLWQQEEEKRRKAIEETRRSAVGRGMRAEKIRTYNYPQNRVTDHRIKKSWKNLDEVLDGSLEKVIELIKQKN
jgi:peptide chain release factor 1